MELYERRAAAAGVPIVVFNGELDRIRGGYYPSFFFPALAKASPPPSDAASPTLSAVSPSPSLMCPPSSPSALSLPRPSGDPGARAQDGGSVLHS